MTTTYPVLTSKVQVCAVDVSVTSAADGLGQAVPYIGVTDAVFVRNQDKNYKIEYKADGGNWTLLDPGKEAVLDLDMSVSALRLRLANLSPSGVPVQIGYAPRPAGVYIPDAGGDKEFFNDGASAYSLSVSQDRQKIVTRGSRVIDWRVGTYTDSGASAAISTTIFCPDGSAVAAVNGDGATGATFSNFALVANIGTVGVDSIGIWVMVPSRNTSLKSYRSVPLKLLLAPLAGYSNFITLPFTAVADGRWHFYVLDPYSNTPTGTFVWGDSTNGVIGQVRCRPSADNGVNASAEKGTDPLQSGETVYFGGVYFGPRGRAMAMVRFDDGLSSLVSNKQAVLSSQYVGQSGVTIPAGSYSAYDLVTAFGHKAAAFILTRHIDTTTTFATSAELRQLQTAGWEICFQSHDNPRSSNQLGVRLLGPVGAPMIESSRSMSWVASTGVFTNTGDNLIDSSSPGQGNPITLIGSPPSPFVAGATYWIRALSTTTFALFGNEADSIVNTNRINPAVNGSGTFGWNWRNATTDSTAILADFQQGRAAMAAMGLKGTSYWAPNQGAFDWRCEKAFVASGMRGWFTTHQYVRRSSAGRGAMFSNVIGLNDIITYIPPFATLMTARQTDASTDESTIRSYVQNLCATGTIGQNFHHGFTTANTLLLCHYLDELKLRQDRGELEVALPSRICDVIDNVKID